MSDATALGLRVDLTTMSVTQLIDGTWLGVADSIEGTGPQMLRSENGFDWQELPAQVTGLPPDTSGPYQLLSLHSKVVLVGRGELSDNGTLRGSVAAVSDDGLNWKRIPNDRTKSIGGSSNLHVARVAHGGAIAFLGEIDTNSLETGGTHWGAYDVHVLLFDAQEPWTVPVPAGYRATSIRATSTGLLLNLVDVETQLYTLWTVDVGSRTLQQLPAEAQEEPMFDAIIGEVLFDLGDLFSRGPYRASFDYGRTWTEYDGPPHQPVASDSFSVFGALGDVEPPFQDAEYVQLSRDGLLWDQFPVPPTTSTVTPLHFGPEGALVLLELKPATNFAQALFGFLPWPADSSSLPSTAREALLAPDQDPIRPVATLLLAAVDTIDDDLLACASTTAGSPELSDVLAAMLDCDAGYLDLVRSKLISDAEFNFFSLPALTDCVTEQAQLITEDNLRSSISIVADPRGLVSFLSVDLLLSCRDVLATLSDSPVTRDDLFELVDSVSTAPLPAADERTLIVRFGFAVLHRTFDVGPLTISLFGPDGSDQALGFRMSFSRDPAFPDRGAVALDALLLGLGVELDEQSFSALLVGDAPEFETSLGRACSQAFGDTVVIDVTIADLPCQFFAASSG